MITPTAGSRRRRAKIRMITGTTSLADSSISPTMIIGTAPSRCRVSYSRVPAATVPITPPIPATAAISPALTGARPGPDAA